MNDQHNDSAVRSPEDDKDGISVLQDDDTVGPCIANLSDDDIDDNTNDSTGDNTDGNTDDSIDDLSSSEYDMLYNIHNNTPVKQYGVPTELLAAINYIELGSCSCSSDSTSSTDTNSDSDTEIAFLSKHRTNVVHCEKVNVYQSDGEVMYRSSAYITNIDGRYKMYLSD